MYTHRIHLPSTVIINLIIAIPVIISTPYAFSVMALSGTITDTEGKPIAQSRIFLELGVEGPVVEGTVQNDGIFEITCDLLPAGLIAWAQGYGFNGLHLNPTSVSDLEGLQIVLKSPTSLSGQVTNTKGEPIPKARLAGFAIVEPNRVGVPLFKLVSLGIPTPYTDEQGRFLLNSVPEGSKLLLKFDHPHYAQEATSIVSAGETNVNVVMYEGVLLRGKTTLRDTNGPISGSTVVIRNAQPPHETALAITDGTGTFQLRVKPGVYLLQAHAEGRISPGLKRVDVVGEVSLQQVQLILVPKGTIFGTVNDAKSGLPIAGVPIILETQGQIAGFTRTQENGTFRLSTAEGSHFIRLKSCAGYKPPVPDVFPIVVTGGQSEEIPGIWLVPDDPSPSTYHTP